MYPYGTLFFRIIAAGSFLFTIGFSLKAKPMLTYFRDGPVFKVPCFNAGIPGSITVQGTNIPDAKQYDQNR